MSDFKPRNLDEDNQSQSSDEKMDTGTESYRSQGTPSSNISSDFDEKSIDNVLRLQNPNDYTHDEIAQSNQVLRLANIDTNITRLKEDLSDSFLTKMSDLHLNSPKNSLGVSPPKSLLVQTNSHPLMGLAYPDVVPSLPKSKEEEKDLSLSSVEDERIVENGYLYSPQINTSKNNLYFSENFSTVDGQMCVDKPDVAKVGRRKIVPRFLDTPKKVEPENRSPHMVLGRTVHGQRDESAIHKYIEERYKKLSSQSTPKPNFNDSDVSEPEFHSAISVWKDTSNIRTVPNFDLPIELSRSITVDELPSPDVVSSSEDHSAYQALVDPQRGSVALRHRQGRSPNAQRRKIMLPPEDDDCCSLDSVSESLDSDEEPPQLEPAQCTSCRSPSVDDIKRSKSTNTGSESSDVIPEYSAADELRHERSWLTVHGNTCDMKVIEPFKRVLSHGGYDAHGGAAIIVFSACHLPDNHRADYKYVMDNLFLYVIWTLERLVTSEYVLVYLHGSAGKRRLPSCRWLQESYRLVDRRLRKNLKHLYLVHPTFWLKSFVILTRPFVSYKFHRKLSYVTSLAELEAAVHVEPNAIPELVKEFDRRR